MRVKLFIIPLIVEVFLFSCGFLNALAEENQKIPSDQQTPPTRAEPRVPSEDELIQELESLLARGDNIITMEGLDFFMQLFVKYDSDRGYARLVQRIMDIPEFDNFNQQYPDQAYKFSSLRLRMLTHFEDYPGVREFVIRTLEGPISHLQCAAAATLLMWDEWELAAPVICRYEAYHLFQIHRDERAIPILEEAVKNASWHGRLFAAAALFYTYGDSSKYPQAALDVILNAPINTNDKTTNCAKFLALDQVARFDLTQALPGLIRMAQDTAQGISPKATGYLVDLARMGHSEAFQALIDIKDNHPDVKIREFAKNGLLKIEQQQK
jgi:hypothetical protein